MQKTAYVVRISDWSSDVCSSDLADGGEVGEAARLRAFGGRGDESVRCDVVFFGHRGCKVPGSGVRGNKHVIFRVHGCARRSLASGTNRPFSDLDGPIWRRWSFSIGPDCRSEEHTSELQSLMRISYAVFCLKKKK